MTDPSAHPHDREVLHCVADDKDVFGEWLAGLKDVSGRAAILGRIDRVEAGNWGHKGRISEKLRNYGLSTGG